MFDPIIHNLSEGSAGYAEAQAYNALIAQHPSKGVTSLKDKIEIVSQWRTDCRKALVAAEKALKEDKQPRFKVGQQYLSNGKHPNVCTIIDIHTTRNLAGDVVGQCYLCEHEFMGQKIKHTEVDATVAMGLCRLTGKSSVLEALAVGA